MSTEENQLDEYFRSNFTRGVIDHALRADVDEQGRVSFYIHPLGVDGETLDCWVLDNCVFDKRGLSPEDVARMLKDLARASNHEGGGGGGSENLPAALEKYNAKLSDSAGSGATKAEL